MCEAETLILAVEKYPCLWNIHDNDYHNRDVKDLAWENVFKEVIKDWDTCTKVDKENKDRMSSHQYGRGGQVQRGNPASGTYYRGRGNGPGTRSQRRAFEYQQSKAFDEDWAQAKEFEERPPKPRGPTQRSLNWKSRSQEKKPVEKKDAAASYDFRAKEETAPIDEPLYDLGPHSSSIPVQESYSQNFEFSGYIDQVERTYELMRGIDPRLDRRLPFSMFQHSMTTILNT